MNFKLIKNVPLENIKREVALNARLWAVDKTRAQLSVQRETNSIFLRGVVRSPTIAIDDTHESSVTTVARLYPHTMKLMHELASELNGKLCRALLARLRPGGKVYPHIDLGEYYKTRRRFHVVVQSEFSSMTCGGETVRMREGELWEFNNKNVHSAENLGSTDRVHLIFDLEPR